MKKSLITFSDLLFSTGAFSQTCPKIYFTYDEMGNRTERELVIEQCGGGARATEKPALSFPISVYPNPARDKIMIGLTADTTANESSITLVDLTGKTVYSAATASLQIQVDVSKLAPGIYIFEVRRGEKKATYNVKKS